MNTPSTPSPGPGWWMASDRQWYPQQWEYNCYEYWGQDTSQILQEALPKLDQLGSKGWEMVSHSVSWTPSTDGLLFTFTYYFKRAVRHQ
jgi:hypothetical protein